MKSTVINFVSNYQLSCVKCEYTNNIGRRLCNFGCRVPPVFVNFCLLLLWTRIILVLLSQPSHCIKNWTVLLLDSNAFWIISRGRLSLSDFVFRNFDLTDVINVSGFPSDVTFDTSRRISLKFFLFFRRLFRLESNTRCFFLSFFVFRSFIRTSKLTLFTSISFPCPLVKSLNCIMFSSVKLSVKKEYYIL